MRRGVRRARQRVPPAAEKRKAGERATVFAERTRGARPSSSSSGAPSGRFVAPPARLQGRKRAVRLQAVSERAERAEDDVRKREEGRRGGAGDERARERRQRRPARIVEALSRSVPPLASSLSRLEKYARVRLRLVRVRRALGEALVGLRELRGGSPVREQAGGGGEEEDEKRHALGKRVAGAARGGREARPSQRAARVGAPREPGRTVARGARLDDGLPEQGDDGEGERAAPHSEMRRGQQESEPGGVGVPRRARHALGAEEKEEREGLRETWGGGRERGGVRWRLAREAVRRDANESARE